MRIGLVTNTFLPMVGGVEWKVHYLATEYARQGHDAIVFAQRPQLTLGAIPLPVEPEYKLVWCSLPICGIGYFGIAQRLFRHAILREHRANPLNVLHCHALDRATEFGVGAKKVAGIPVVATTCGHDIQLEKEINYGSRLNPRFDALVRSNMQNVDVIGSISSSVRAELEAIPTAARIVDIPNGVSWQDFQGAPSGLLREKLGLAKDVAIVLSVGRNHVKKGYESGIRAFAAITSRFTRACYVIVGRNVSALAPLVESLGVERSVYLLDEMPMALMPEVFHSADIFLNPSLMEGFAQVNAQALACGLPCVLTDAPGNRDAGDHGGALIAKSGNVESLAAAIAKLLDDPPLRGRLAQEAHRASRRYAWEQIAGEYLAIFASLDAGKSRP